MDSSIASVKIGLCADVLITEHVREKMKSLFPEAYEKFNQDDEAMGMMILYHALDNFLPEIGANLPADIINITLD